MGSGPRIGVFLVRIFQSVEVAGGKPDEVARHCSRSPEALPRISDALPQLGPDVDF